MRVFSIPGCSVEAGTAQSNVKCAPVVQQSCSLKISRLSAARREFGFTKKKRGQKKKKPQSVDIIKVTFSPPKASVCWVNCSIHAVKHCTLFHVEFKHRYVFKKFMSERRRFIIYYITVIKNEEICLQATLDLLLSAIKSNEWVIEMNLLIVKTCCISLQILFLQM